MTKLSETILPNGIVTLDNTATLTNKTISALNNTITDVGLSYVDETLSSTAPNDGINSVALSAVAPTDNADFALITKGNGALLKSTPDNTTTGGNKRGIYGVDLQSYRLLSSEVASGNVSTISGGQRNTASNSYTTVSGGNQNTASGYASTIGGGENNLASALRTVIAGGIGNTAGGSNSVVIGGENSTASGSGAIAGGYASIASSDWGIALGRENTVSGNYSTAMGYSNSISAIGSVALGYDNNITSSYSAVVGNSNIVGSGDYQFVSGFDNATATSNYSVTLGFGHSNTGLATTLLGYDHTTNSSADYSFAVGQTHSLLAYGTGAIGRGHSVSGDYGFTAGQSNTITTLGDWGTAFGANNNVNSKYATVLGKYGTSRDRISSLTISAFPINNTSCPAQTVFISMGIETLNSSQYYALQTDISQTYKYIYQPPATGATFKMLVFAHIPGGSTAKGWEITGVVRRDNSNSVAPVFVGTPTITVIAEDAGASAWQIVLDTTTSGSWFPRGLGASAATVRWSASVWLTEI
jgi:hypothetical protein